MQRAVQPDVLAPGEVLSEAGAQLEERDHPAAAVRSSRVERHDAGETAQKRRLPGAVAAHHPDGLARHDMQVEVPQGIYPAGTAPPERQRELLERARPLVDEAERARGALEHYLTTREAHSTTARSRSIRR